MSRTRIKICGVRDVDSALAAVEAGADAIGLVFAPGSPRRIDPDQGWEIIQFLPPFISAVGLFVDPTVEELEVACARCPFDLIQLHGHESEEFVREIGVSVVKALRFDPRTIADELRRWSDVPEVSALLIDGSSGGRGVSFDWPALAEARSASEHPIILAGGLTPNNVAEAIAVVRPFAVDVSSGVESSQGVKDPALIAAFCRAVRESDDA